MNSSTQITQRAEHELGDFLRYWRRQRGKSQLDLPLDKGVSQRHISLWTAVAVFPARLPRHRRLVLPSKWTALKPLTGAVIRHLAKSRTDSDDNLHRLIRGCGEARWLNEGQSRCSCG